MSQHGHEQAPVGLILPFQAVVAINIPLAQRFLPHEGHAATAVGHVHDGFRRQRKGQGHGHVRTACRDFLALAANEEVGHQGKTCDALGLAIPFETVNTQFLQQFRCRRLIAGDDRFLQDDGCAALFDIVENFRQGGDFCHPARRDDDALCRLVDGHLFLQGMGFNLFLLTEEHVLRVMQRIHAAYASRIIKNDIRFDRQVFGLAPIGIHIGFFQVQKTVSCRVEVQKAIETGVLKKEP